MRTISLKNWCIKLTYVLLGTLMLNCSKVLEVPPTGIISVTVTDNISKEPIKDAIVTFPSGAKNTDSEGKASSGNLNIGSHEVSIVAIGYKPEKKSIHISLNELSPKEPIGLDVDLPSVLSFDPNTKIEISDIEREKSVFVTNKGGQGLLILKITPDPSSQWLTVTPQTFNIDEKKGVIINVKVDSRGKDINQQYSSTIRYSIENKENYKGTGSYEIIMNVKSPIQTAKPIISDIFPINGRFGSNVTINGQNFGNNISAAKVFFNNVEAQVISVNENTITAKVPIGAKTGKVKVQIGPESQNFGESNKDFFYELTYTVKPVTVLKTPFYISDLTSSPDGTIYFSGMLLFPNTSTIQKNAIFKLSKGDNFETTVFEQETGFADGSLNGLARMVYPTKITYFDNTIFVADNNDPNINKSNVSSGYSSIRKISNNILTTLQKEDGGFIHDILGVSKLNGILYTDGRFYKYDFGDLQKKELSTYLGLSVFLDTDGIDIYSLDLNVPQWRLRKRDVNSSLGELGSTKPINLGKTSGLYIPKGMAIDVDNNLAYILDNNVNNNITLYSVNLTNMEVQVVFEGKTNNDVLDNGVLANGGIASFNSVSCIHYDKNTKSLLFIDVLGGNVLRRIECR